MSARLSNVDRAVLEAMDPEYQYNDWGLTVPSLQRPHEIPRVLRALKRRGLVGSEGRGKWAQFWITDAGLRVIGKERTA